MARETRAEREARLAQEQAAYSALQATTYPDRLMALLERAQKTGFDLSVKEGKFVLKDRSDPLDRLVSMSAVYSQENDEALHDLQWRVDMKEAEEREQERKRLVKQAALSKLSLEERELLGLK